MTELLENPEDSEFSARALELQQAFIDTHEDLIAANDDGSLMCSEGLGDQTRWMTMCILADDEGAIGFFATAAESALPNAEEASEDGQTVCVGDDFFTATESPLGADLVSSLFDCEPL